MLRPLWPTLITALVVCSGVNAAPPKAAAKAPGATAAECKDTCLLLTRLSFDEVQKNICSLCGGHDEIFCELDWPASDVPSCSIWDDMRNCIFAAHGHVFKSPAYKTKFEGKPWHRANPKFDAKTLPKVAQDNVQRLLRYKKQRYQCTLAP